MSNAMTALPKDHPLIRAWEAYKATDEYANTRKWAAHDEHVDGSLWASFMAGFYVAADLAASLSESVDNASDAERVNGSPGAGAMGAVIEYRDKIRKLRHDR